MIFITIGFAFVDIQSRKNRIRELANIIQIKTIKAHVYKCNPNTTEPYPGSSGRMCNKMWRMDINIPIMALIIVKVYPLTISISFKLFFIF